MPRNTNVTEMQAKLARYNERTKEAAATLSKLEESRNALKAKAGVVGMEEDMSGEEAGEIFAAIATALYEVTEDVHDVENTVLTISKVTRNYSPWSSKLYGLREVPKK